MRGRRMEIKQIMVSGLLITVAIACSACARAHLQTSFEDQAACHDHHKPRSWQDLADRHRPKPDTTEAQVVELNNGALMLNMRDNRGGVRAVHVTADLGQ